jgi:molybdopterin-biosynthesis enzyme MoeA-like protein
MTNNPTACLLIIGNEVLSGRTRDANLQYLATRLGEIGIPLREARVIPDVPETIIAAVHEPSRAAMAAEYARRDPPVEFNAARLRMATLPKGAVPIVSSETMAPGFSMANVHVMAGVPRIMRAMFEALAPSLEGGAPILSHTVHADYVYEGQIAAGLSAIQAKYPALDLGSYPYYRGKGGGVALVAKGTDAAAVDQAAAECLALLAGFGAAHEGEPAPE